MQVILGRKEYNNNIRCCLNAGDSENLNKKNLVYVLDSMLC